MKENPVVIFGDVHGQANLLKKLIDKIRNKFGQDVEIYSVGDLIDRGPDSKEVIQICIDENIRGQMGNHEQWFRELIVNRFYHEYCQQPIMGGEATLTSYGVDIHSDGSRYYAQGRPSKELGIDLFQAIPEDHRKWIAALPYYRVIKIDGINYWLIHAGLIGSSANSAKSKKNISDFEMMDSIAKHNPDTILWPSPNLGLIKSGLIKKPGAVEDDNLYHFKQGIQVFGHRPVREPIIKEHFIALDTGCGTCQPFTLSAIVLPSKEIIQVEDDWT